MEIFAKSKKTACQLGQISNQISPRAPQRPTHATMSDLTNLFRNGVPSYDEMDKLVYGSAYESGDSGNESAEEFPVQKAFTVQKALALGLFKNKYPPAR